MTQIKFRRDTSFRKELFTPDSFAHPAKMDAQLLIWIVEKYTKVGETVLDPMAGMGTTMLACMLGRNCILVELEQKFVDMAKANWEKVKMMPQLGCEMRECQIIQGDARNLGGIVDGIITSPPYAEAQSGGGISAAMRGKGKYKVTTKLPGSCYQPSEAGGSKDNIQNLPYGSIDSVITSPPYAEAQEGGGIAKQGYMNTKRQAKNPDLVGNRSYMPKNIGDAEGQIGNKPYGNIDSIITSPPYEGSVQGAPGIDWTKMDGGSRDMSKEQANASRIASLSGYSINRDNIGNLKADSYLSAMLQVYQQCHKVLKPQGLMILVTKNFIRNKKEVKLDEDTIKLCEQAGFQFIERHHRKLSAQSFWRVIYNKKYPEAPVLDKEDILVFQRLA